jgi:hypothetical protein
MLLTSLVIFGSSPLQVNSLVVIFLQQVDELSPRVKPLGDDYKIYAATKPQQDT